MLNIYKFISLNKNICIYKLYSIHLTKQHIHIHIKVAINITAAVAATATFMVLYVS